MPQVLAFLPCQKLILSKEDGTASLISIIQGINALKPTEDTKIPEDTSVPLSWYILVIWRRLPSDKGKEFEQKILMRAEDGTELIRSLQVFRMENINHQVSAQIYAFPISHPGVCLLSLSLREIPSSEWEEKGSYPIDVGYIASPPAPAQL